MADALSGRHLTLIRGERCLINDLEFSLGSGELLLIEGANGSGKTSLLRGIVGLTSFEEGLVRWNGADVKDNRQAFHSKLVWMGHRPGFKGDLTLLENLRFESGLRTMATATAEYHLSRLGLMSLTELPFRALSAGQQRRVALARMVLADAPLWIMDEPFTNLDAAGQELLVDVLAGHLHAGGLCVMATHHELAIEASVHRVRLG